jgi:hypothetical protein
LGVDIAEPFQLNCLRLCSPREFADFVLHFRIDAYAACFAVLEQLKYPRVHLLNSGYATMVGKNGFNKPLWIFDIVYVHDLGEFFAHLQIKLKNVLIFDGESVHNT